MLGGAYMLTLARQIDAASLVPVDMGANVSLGREYQPVDLHTSTHAARADCRDRATDMWTWGSQGAPELLWSTGTQSHGADELGTLCDNASPVACFCPLRTPCAHAHDTRGAQIHGASYGARVRRGAQPGAWLRCGLVRSHVKLPFRDEIVRALSPACVGTCFA